MNRNRGEVQRNLADTQADMPQAPQVAEYRPATLTLSFRGHSDGRVGFDAHMHDATSIDVEQFRDALEILTRAVPQK